MLRPITDKLAFFKRDDGIIHVTVDALRSPKEFTSSESNLLAFHDKRDACLHKTVMSLKLTYQDNTEQLDAVFVLADMSKINVILESKKITPPNEFDKEFVLVKCAAESILRKLFAKKLVLNETIPFTAIRGTSTSSQWNFYCCHLQLSTSKSQSKNIEHDTLEKIEALLHTNELHLKFVSISAFLREEIESVLQTIIPAKPAAEVKASIHK